MEPYLDLLEKRLREQMPSCFREWKEELSSQRQYEICKDNFNHAIVLLTELRKYFPPVVVPEVASEMIG